MYQALYRQFRPLRFDSVYGQEHITRILENQLSRGLLGHAYLFTGTRGTGKTTCAKILARAVNCEHPDGANPCNECEACRSILSGAAVDVTELDAASNNGVDAIRAILAEAAYPPVALKKRVYIIDEVHMLSIGAFNALLKTLEEPPEHVLFILATTELHKVPQTILSRCQRFDFRRADTSVIASNLRKISDAAGIDVDDDALTLIARLGDGSFRDAQSLLERCRTAGGASRLDVAAVTDALGVAGTEASMELALAVSNGDVPGALRILDTRAREGRDMRAILEELAAVLRDGLIWQASADADLLRSGADPAALQPLCDAMSGTRLAQTLSLIRDTLDRLVRSASGRTETELCLIRACMPSSAVVPAASGTAAPSAPAASADLNGVYTRLAALEHSMQTAPGELSRRISKLEQAMDELPAGTVIPAPENAADTPSVEVPAEPVEASESEPLPEVPDENLPKLSPELKDKLNETVVAELGVMKAAFWIDSDFYFDGLTLYVIESPFCRDMVTSADMPALTRAVQAALGDGVKLRHCDEPPKAPPDFSGFDQIMDAWNESQQRN